jgi:hypothetical protein
VQSEHEKVIVVDAARFERDALECLVPGEQYLADSDQDGRMISEGASSEAVKPRELAVGRYTSVPSAKVSAPSTTTPR